MSQVSSKVNLLDDEIEHELSMIQTEANRRMESALKEQTGIYQESLD